MYTLKKEGSGLKKALALIMCVLMLLSLCSCAVKQTNGSFDPAVLFEKPAPDITVTALKNGASCALAYFCEALNEKYGVEFAADKNTAGESLLNGKTEFLLCGVPEAARLYNETGGGVQILCACAFDGFYLVSKNDISSVNDLEGEKIAVSPAGGFAESITKYILSANGLTADGDYEFSYYASEKDIADALNNGSAQTAVLAEPYLSSALAADGVTVALNLGEEFASTKDNRGSKIITGCVVAKREYVLNNPDIISDFLEDMKAACEYIATDSKAPQALADSGFFADRRSAEIAIPHCGTSFMRGYDMRVQVSRNVAAVYEINPESLGGDLPDDGFCYLL